MPEIRECHWCQGEGRRRGEVCDGCGGSGRRQRCRRAECQEHGCSGYGDCKVLPAAAQEALRPGWLKREIAAAARAMRRWEEDRGNA